MIEGFSALPSIASNSAAAVRPETQQPPRAQGRRRTKEAKVFVLRDENRFYLDPAFVARYVDKQPTWGFGILSRITYERTYARPVSKALLHAQAVAYRGMNALEAREFAKKSKQTHEQYWQTVLRVVEGVSSILKQQVRDTGQAWSDDEEQHHAQEMFMRMWNFKFTPPGRGLWFMGTEAMELKGSAALNNCFVGAERFVTQEHGAARFDAVVDTRVTVLTPDGWRPAVVRAFGEQRVQDVTFAPADFGTRNGGVRTSRSNLRVSVRVTPDHRWITLNRGEVTDLRVGDSIAAQVNRDEMENESYRAGRVHGLIFGDGTAGYQHLTANTRAYHIRLCGEKARAEVGRFDNVTYPSSYGGDPYCHVTSSRDLKQLPHDDAPDYLRGFLDGWIVADASIKPDGATYRLASQHPDAETWLRQHAATAGWLLTGVAMDKATTTNFGPRAHPLTAYSLTRQRRAWVVTQIDELDEPETVYCAQVPDTHSFTLAAGIHTGNCGFVSTEHIAHDFAEPFCVLIDYSMLGVGMGFDLRGAGLVTLVTPATSLDVHVVEDSREGWIECVRTVLNAFVGRGALPRAWDYSKVRKEGAPLKTFGGTASGPKPLEQLLTTLTAMLYAAVGQPISGKTITSIMNVIGKCVVAGNVRRSSEIALGDPEDTDFITLKDPTELNAMRARLGEIEKANPAWVALQAKIDKHRKKRKDKGLGVLDAEFGAIQGKIDKLEKKQKQLLEGDAAWAALNAEIDAHPLMAYLWASNNTALCPQGYDYDALAASTVLNGEPGYAWLDVIRAYGRLIDPPNWKDRNAKGFNPCGEQTLHDMELCCLVETYPTKHDDLDDYLLTLKYAYRYAKAVTLVPTHNKRTNAVMVRNRRIGTSMAGVIEQYSKLGLQECIRWWDTGYREIRKWDVEYSGWLGVNESIKSTSIKPGGTTPLLAGVEGGMKAPTSRYYMRTIRFDYRSPLVKQLADAGYRVEKDRTTPRTMVVYFPCETKPGVLTAEELGLWEQAQIFTALQRYWSDNMVSATLTFQPHEANTLARLLKCYEGQWKCVSFLPLSNHGFLQAPYIPCTKEQYEEANAKVGPVGELTVEHDTDDKWCSGGVCELPVGK